MASIEEVAREAGVSITTVSRVFSGKRPVAPDTRGGWSRSPSASTTARSAPPGAWRPAGP